MDIGPRLRPDIATVDMPVAGWSRGDHAQRADLAADQWFKLDDNTWFGGWRSQLQELVDQHPGPAKGLGPSIPLD